MQVDHWQWAESLPHIVWGARPDGFVEYVNSHGVAYVGLPAERFQGWGWRTLIHPEDAPSAQAAWDRAIQRGSPYQAEYRLRRNDGAYRWQLARALPDRELQRWTGTCTDIDEQMRAAQDRERRLTRERQTRVAAVAARQARHHARLQLAIQAANVGLWDWDLRTDTVYFSPEYKRQLGHDEAELNEAFSEWERRLHPEDRERIIQRVQAYVAKPWPDYEAEFRLRHQDGSYRWVLTRAELVYDAEGKPSRMLGCHLDITERKRAEEALRQSEHRFAAFMDNLPGFAWMKDLRGRYAYVNGRTAQCPPVRGDWLGKTDAQLWPSELATHYQASDQQVMARREALQTIEPYGAPGNQRYMLVSKFPVFDAAGAVVMVGGTGIDITERMRAEQELRESEERFRQLADNIDEVFWLADARLQSIVYVSPAYERIRGRTCESLRKEPRSFLDAIHPDDRLRALETIWALPDAPTEVEYRIVRPDGTMRWIRNRAFPVRDASGRVIRIAGLAEDVTERRHLEMQLRQAQKMEAIGRLAGGVAHDFNNLLSVIFGHSELLATGLPSPDRLRDSLAEIRGAAERAAALTRQLLTFGRRQIVEPKRLDLNAVVAESRDLWRRLIGEDVTLALTLFPRLSAVRADPVQIDQVLMNLALNAREAMAQGGRLTIETRDVVLDAAYRQAKPGRYVLLAVADTGCGMTPEVQARIFEPFFSTKPDGTGLGLSVVDGIVKQSGGHLAVESQPGVGTTFKVYLPALDEPPAPAPERTPDRPVVGGSETVLLVEDEDPVREVSALLLKTLGYRVVQAANAEEALHRFDAAEETIDLLMTDVVMPGRNGCELAEILRARDAGLKVLFQSGYTGDTVVRRGILNAEMAFLKKPFTLDTLARKVREVLDGR